MFKLKASYSVTLPNSLRIQRDSSEQLEYSSSIGEFEVAIRIVRDNAPRIEQPEKLPVTVASVVEVTASRLEHEEPPPVPLTVTEVAILLNALDGCRVAKMNINKQR